MLKKTKKKFHKLDMGIFEENPLPQIPADNQVNFDHKMNINQINNNIKDIYDKIEEAHLNLQQSFYQQEEIILEYYETKMLEAQKELVFLQRTLNENELKKKMEEQRDNLLQQRQVTLSNAVNLQKKQQEFTNNQKSLIKLINQIKEENNFLEEQYVFAIENNKNLKSEVEQIKEKILAVDPNFNFDFEDASYLIKDTPSNLQSQASLAIQKKTQSSVQHSTTSIQQVNEQSTEINAGLMKKKKLDEYQGTSIMALRKQLADAQQINRKLNLVNKSDIFVKSTMQEQFENQLQLLLNAYNEKSIQDTTQNSQSQYKEIVEQSQSIPQTSFSLNTELINNQFSKTQKLLLIENLFQNDEMKKQMYNFMFQEKEKEGEEVIKKKKSILASKKKK